jgi:glycerol-3-phosphate acyltransferase PlsY
VPQTAVFTSLLCIGAYLLGSIPAAFIIAKWSRGIDLRKVGSGNVGFSNLAASTSKYLAVPVFIFDVGKGALAVFAARWAGLPLPLQAVVGICAIAGHNWPVFLKFNAGRGILTTVGVGVALIPKLGAALVLLSFVGIPFHLLALTSLIAVFLFPLLTYFSSAPVISWLVGTSFGGDRLPMVIILFGIWLLVPMRRLTAPRSSRAANVSTGQLLLTRFLFDRDIKDRKVWLHQSHETDNAR